VLCIFIIRLPAGSDNEYIALSASWDIQCITATRSYDIVGRKLGYFRFYLCYVLVGTCVNSTLGLQLYIA